MKNHRSEDWHLDLRPVRRPARSAPVEPAEANNIAPAAPPDQPVATTEVSPELIALIHSVQRSIASLDARVKAIETALARAQRQAAKARQKPPTPIPTTPEAASQHPDVVSVSSEAPDAESAAPNGAVRITRSDTRRRANQLRKSPLPQALTEESA